MEFKKVEKKLRLSLVGPLHPFKGGIAHHNTLLANEFLKHSDIDLQVISFKRIFPAWVYWRTQRKNAKDIESKNFFQGQAEFILDMLNPITWWRTVKKIKAHHPEVVIFHWYTPLLAPPFWILTALIKRYTTARIVAMCHNVLPHEKLPLDKFLTGLVFKNVDACIVQSEADRMVLHAWLPNKATINAFHPFYDFFYQPIPRETAQKKLGISGRALLFFGGIRKYKGLPYLLEALAIVVREMPVTLVIAGEFFHDKKPYLDQIKNLGIEKYVKIVDRYISNEEVPTFFLATDALVTPYIYGPQSGAAAVAYSFEKPVIGSENLKEVIREGQTGFLARAKDSADLAMVILKFYRESGRINFAMNIQNIKREFSWEALCQRIISGLWNSKA